MNMTKFRDIRFGCIDCGEPQRGSGLQGLIFGLNTARRSPEGPREESVPVGMRECSKLYKCGRQDSEKRAEGS